MNEFDIGRGRDDGAAKGAGDVLYSRTVLPFGPGSGTPRMMDKPVTGIGGPPTLGLAVMMERMGV